MPPASGKGPRITVTDARGTHARFRNVLAREKLGGCLEPGTDCIRRRRAAIDEDARVQYNPGSLAGLGGTGPRTDAGGTVADSHDDSRARDGFNGLIRRCSHRPGHRTGDGDDIGVSG
jgi:hypothetical protein